MFWLLFPIAGVQGLILRKSAMKLPPPPTEASGSCGHGRVINLLALGDSIIAGVGASDQKQTLALQLAEELSSTTGMRVDWHVDGENGANLASLLVRLLAIEPEMPADVILLSIGVNDVTGLTSTRRWRGQLQLMAKQIQARWPQALIVFTGLPPMGQFPLPPQPLSFSLSMRAETLDCIAIEELAVFDRIVHVPTKINSEQYGFCEDGFHPSAESYEIWAAELAHRIVCHHPGLQAVVKPDSAPMDTGSSPA